jgi:hypothetical protein
MPFTSLGLMSNWWDYYIVGDQAIGEKRCQSLKSFYFDFLYRGEKDTTLVSTAWALRIGELATSIARDNNQPGTGI